MRITMLAVGSRGDVQPFTALGLGLKRAGCDVRIASATDYEDVVAPYGIKFAPLVGSVRELMDRQMIYGLLDEAENPLHFITGMMESVRPLIRRLIEDVYAASLGADALIVSTLGYYAGYDVAEKLGIPIIPTHLHPNVPTRAYPHLFFPPFPVPRSRLGALYNLLSYKLADGSYWPFILGPLNEARRAVLDLPPIGPADILARVRNVPRPVLHAYSSSLTRTPPDWDRAVHVTGYWFLDRPPGWQPDPDLVAFLESGPPPVYMGFGSNLIGRDPDKVTALILRALERAGQRGILMSGWGDLGNIALPDSVYKVDSVPHDWLFSKVVAVVSHAGAGTTAATLRAGIPPVLVPFFGDQFFWSARVARMGLGPEPVPRRQLTEENLAAAIRQAVTDKTMRCRAALAGERLRAEKGVERAVAVLTSGG